MLLHFHLSNSAFERLIKMRVQAEFRPIDQPFLFKQQQCYMDGFDIGQIEIGRSSRSLSFGLNRRQGDSVVPAGPAQTYQPMVAKISGALMLASVASVRAAGVVGPGGRYGLPDRPDELRLPFFGAELDVFFTVAASGMPTLNVSLKSLPGSELLGDVPSFLSSLENLALPFPVGDAFADVLKPGHTRVLNAGIVSQDGGVSIRLEFEPVGEGAAAHSQRMSDWLGFFGSQHQSPLSIRDWAIELPTEELGAKAARDLDDQFDDPDVADRFGSRGPASAAFVPRWPGFQFKKAGTFKKACAGLDIRAELRADTMLSVPAPNTLRTSVGLEADINDWDSVKCTVASLFNPVLAGVITSIDQGVPWFAVPLVAVLQPLLPIAFGLGGDDILVREAIKTAQEEAGKKGGPIIVRTNDTHFFVDVGKKITTPLTRDWMVVQEIFGRGDRLILRGDFTAPDLKTLPRLRGVLTDGFGHCSKKDPCSTNVKWVTVATLALGLEEASGAPVRIPVVPIRYGIDIETVNGKKVPVGQVTWRITDDRQGVYEGPSTLIHWTGSPPGVFEFQVTQPRDPYASAPYPLRMQLFTSMGVREFDIPAPPPVPRPPSTQKEKLSEAAERISNCYIFSTLLTTIKALQVLWLPTPQPGLAVGQHWQVVLRGLDQGQHLRAWNAETQELLAEVSAFEGGLTEVSLALAPEQAMQAMQLTLNDGPPLSVEEYSRLAGGVEGRDAVGEHPARFRQTPLFHVAEIGLGQVADAVMPQRSRDRLSLLLSGAGGLERIELDVLDPGRFPVSTRSAGGGPLPPQLPAGHLRMTRDACDRGGAAELVEPGLGGESRVIARYYARPWYDGGGIADGFFAQIDREGTSVSVYARGATRDVTPDIGYRGARD